MVVGRQGVVLEVEIRMQEEFMRDPRPAHKKVLTPRQKEVLRLLAEGWTMRETGNALQITSRTVAFHKYRIMGGFGLKTTSDLVKFAMRERLISGP